MIDMIYDLVSVIFLASYEVHMDAKLWLLFDPRPCHACAGYPGSHLRFYSDITFQMLSACRPVDILRPLTLKCYRTKYIMD